MPLAAVALAPVRVQQALPATLTVQWHVEMPSPSARLNMHRGNDNDCFDLTALPGHLAQDSFLQELWDKDPSLLATIGSLTASFQAPPPDRTGAQACKQEHLCCHLTTVNLGWDVRM